MRVGKFVMMAVAAMSLSLGGCASTGTSVPGQTDPNVSAVVDAVKLGCAYVAPASQVAAIIANLAGGGAVVDLVTSTANAICNAVTSKGAMRGTAEPQVAGVKLTGYFLSGGPRYTK